MTEHARVLVETPGKIVWLIEEDGALDALHLSCDEVAMLLWRPNER